MSLFSILSYWFKRNPAEEKERLPSLQILRLEPILTPSGLLDTGLPDPGWIELQPDHLPDIPDIHPLDHYQSIESHTVSDPQHFEVQTLSDPHPLEIQPATESDHLEIHHVDTPSEIVSHNLEDSGIIGISDPVPLESHPHFDGGVFTVGETGEVGIDFLYDGGGYKGEVAVFSLEGLDPNAADFAHLAAERALSNSDWGHVVISDPAEDARFSGIMSHETVNWNGENYLGVKTFSMEAGSKFGIMLVPNGTVQDVFDGHGVGDKLPLFSMSTANPNDAFHIGQIADVNGDGNTFVMEDMRVDSGSDRDYNDIIFQVRGATGHAVTMDELITHGSMNEANDWRTSDVGHELVQYTTPLDPVEYPTHPIDPIDVGIVDPHPGDVVLPIDPLTGVEYKPGELLIKFSPAITDTEIHNFAHTHGAIAIDSLDSSDSSMSDWKIIKFEPNTDLQQIRTSFTHDSSVQAIEYNYKLSVNTWDAKFNSLWNLDNTGQTGGTPDADIDAPEAWHYQTGSRSTVVAVIDTGIDYNHQDLAQNIWRNAGEIGGNGIDDDQNGFIDDVRGYDFINNDSNPMDDNSHGTHVAGTIGAVGSNGIGVVGVSQNVNLMPLKFAGANGEGFTTDAVRAVNYASKMGANVINASFGNSAYSQAMFDAISNANNHNVLFVASAGNANNNNDINAYYAANYDLPNVISVAATDQSDRLASFSNYGRNTVDLAAPGVNILSTLPGNQYGWMSGTSMAAPHVAGAAALLFSQNPSQSAAQVKNRLLSTVETIPSMQGVSVTGGRLNVFNAVRPPTPSRRKPYADFNGDGKTDFFRQEKGAWDDDNTNTANIYFSNGNGTFNKKDLTPTYSDLNGDNGVNIIVGDYNGDGETDFIRQEKGVWDDDNLRTAEVFLSNGNGTFSRQSLTDWETMKGDEGANLIIGDYNGDGKDDFIRQEKNNWDNDDNNTANVYLSNGNGTFSKQALTDWQKMKGDDGVNIIVGDYNGDGMDDFINQEKGIWDDDNNFTTQVYVSNGDGTFQNHSLMDADMMKGDDGVNIIVGDYNGDGMDDFIRQEKGVWDDNDVNTANIYLSKGDGNFIRKDLTDWQSMKGDYTNLIVGDYNGDGKDDFIRQEKGSWSVDNNRTAEVYLSNGDGTFSSQPLTDWQNMKGDDGVNIIVGDYNGDGKDDFIRQEKNDWDNDDNITAEIYLATGTGTFVRQSLTDWQSMKGDMANIIVSNSKPSPYFEEGVNESREWLADMYSWNTAEGKPPVSFYNYKDNKLAKLNLGSNTRSDGKKGIEFNWGGSVPKGDPRLPADAYAIRSYTQAYFEAGKRYKARVKADDGYQLFAKNQATNQWVYFTPENEWKQDAYGTYKEIEFQVPQTGMYDFHFHYFESIGNAYFDLSWEEIQVTPPPPPPALPPVMSYEEFNQWRSKPEYTSRNPFPDKGKNCTWYAHGRMMQLGYSEYALDSMWGNAGTWDNTAGRGATVSGTPIVSCIAVWEAGVGAAGPVGHVGVVERVNSDGSIRISESNWDGTSYNTRTIYPNTPSYPSKFIHVPRA